MKKLLIVVSILLAVALLPQEAMGQMPMFELKRKFKSSAHQRGQWFEVEKPEYKRTNYDGHIVYDRVNIPHTIDPVYLFEWALQLQDFFEPKVIKEYYLSFKHEMSNQAQKWPSYNLPETNSANSKANEATMALCVLVESERPYRRIFEYLFKKGASALAERADRSANVTEVAAMKFGQESPVTKMLLEQAEKEKLSQELKQNLQK